MPASNHTLNGNVQAIQYTGSNVNEILGILGPQWAAFTEVGGQRVTFSQRGSEPFQLSPLMTNPTDWLVSQNSALSNQTPALSASFSVFTASQFTQQYSA